MNAPAIAVAGGNAPAIAVAGGNAPAIAVAGGNAPAIAVAGMNRPRPRARIVVRARDPLLRSLIEERLAGLGEILVERNAGSSDASVDAASVDAAPAGITRREMEVLALLAEGLANKQIAGRLGFSTHTAKFHVESLLRKLDAVNRAEAVKEGIRRGLIGV